jgi:putative ABC transport system substrate-binding protein
MNGASPPTMTRSERLHSRRALLSDLARFGGGLIGAALLAGCAPALLPVGRGAPRQYRVGLIGPVGDYQAFWDRLGELGYVEGQNLVKVERLAVEEPLDAKFADYAAELVGLPVDVIHTRTPAAVRAAMDATTSIPIVMALVMSGDPVAQGIVGSLARPGGNVTGVAGAPPDDIDGKRLELLVEAAPGASTVAVIGGNSRDFPAVAPTARSLGVDVLVEQVTERRDQVSARSEHEAVFESFVARGADRLLVRPFAVNPNIDLVVHLAERHRLPALYPSRTWVAEGGLMAYVARADEVDRRTADYVDRILSGVRPADLPIERANRYDLIVNMRTARALGITLSSAFMDQVTEVVEE